MDPRLLLYGVLRERAIGGVDADGQALEARHGGGEEFRCEVGNKERKAESGVYEQAKARPSTCGSGGAEPETMAAPTGRSDEVEQRGAGLRRGSGRVGQS